MQTADRRPTPAILFDSSIDESVDQILALAMVLVYESKREARATAVSISRNNLKVAAFCDAMARFLGAPLSIGMSEAPRLGTTVPPMISAVLEKQTPEGKLAYARVIERRIDTADPVALIRNALTAQQDQVSTIVLAGPPGNLLGLLALPGTKQLIEKKVRTLVIAARFEDVNGFRKLLAEWPSPILFVGDDLNALQFPGASIEGDFAWAANHPLVDAYRAAKPMPYDAPAAAMAAVLHAAHPDDAALRLSDPGTMTVLENGRAQFLHDAQGGHRSLTMDVNQKDRVIQTLRQVVSSRPPDRGRGRGPQ